MATTPAQSGSGEQTDSHISFLARALHTPIIGECFARLAEQARDDT